nr:unnamed protein product [Digitaria exilis]
MAGAPTTCKAVTTLTQPEQLTRLVVWHATDTSSATTIDALDLRRAAPRRATHRLSGSLSSGYICPGGRCPRELGVSLVSPLERAYGLGKKAAAYAAVASATGPSCMLIRMLFPPVLDELQGCSDALHGLAGHDGLSDTSYRILPRAWTETETLEEDWARYKRIAVDEPDERLRFAARLVHTMDLELTRLDRDVARYEDKEDLDQKFQQLSREKEELEQRFDQLAKEKEELTQRDLQLSKEKTLLVQEAEVIRQLQTLDLTMSVTYQDRIAEVAKELGERI